MSTSHRWAALAGALLLAAPACAGGTSSASSASASASSGSSGSSASGDAAPAASVCTPGMDQTCNDNAEISSLHGTCLPDGTCECKAGFPKNEATGRCK